MKRLKARYKKLLLELEFLYSDLEYHEDVSDEAMRSFQKGFVDFCDINNINYDKDLIKEKERKIQVSDPDKVEFRDEDGNLTEEVEKEIEKPGRPEEIRKLFKQIATKTHPDKFSNAKSAEKSLNKQVFLQAKAAAEENNYFKLQQIAQRLGLDLPEIDVKRLKLMEKEAKNIRNKVKKVQKTIAWVWFAQEDEKSQEKVMRRYVSSLIRKKN